MTSDRGRSLAELRGLLEQHARRELDGVRICKVDRRISPGAGTPGATLMIVGEGRKRLGLGEHVYEYGAGQYLVASVDQPVAGLFVDSAAGQPALGFSMTVDPPTVAELLLGAGPGDLPRLTSADVPQMKVSDAPGELLDAVVRLMRLLDQPQDRKTLAPLIKREILWRLITGDQGALVRQVGLADSSLEHISQAVRWIRANYAEPFTIESMAQRAGMSGSAFHRNFQAVTAMAPIQFQKHLRLQAARLLLANSPHDVTSVGRQVGYENLSQFSREYRRQFGAPPSIDAARLRQNTTA
jgi:AraC-like DNA-binding protein